MALFDGTDTPKWMSPAIFSLESEKASESIGRNFVAGMQAGQQSKQNMMNFMLKQQELSNEGEQRNAAALANVAKQNVETQKMLGYADLGHVIGKVGEYEGGWNSPAFQKDFWSTAAKHPEVMSDARFPSITNNFDLAQKAQYNAELAGQRDTIRSQIEAENRASREQIAQERNSAMLQAKELEIQHKVRDRLGDMGYRAFLGEVKAINDNLLVPESKKRMEIRRLYDQAEGGLYQPSKPPQSPAATGQTSTTPVASQSISKPQSQEEFNALPSGSLYINPADGKQYRKK